MADFIQLLYDHPQGRPKKHAEQQAAAFSSSIPLEDIRFSRPCLSAWATRLVGNEAYRCMGRMAKKKDDTENCTHIRATTNGRKEGANVVTWERIKFTIKVLHAKMVFVRKRRPHPVIQVGAISAFSISRKYPAVHAITASSLGPQKSRWPSSRSQNGIEDFKNNSYASGDLALPLGIWHLVCKSHVDVKRVYCRFGSTVSDSAARHALNSMTDASLVALQSSVRDATARGESEWGNFFDSVQQHSLVYEHGLGRDKQMMLGTACTTFRYEDTKPGGFNADDHIARIIKQERQSMTTEMPQLQSTKIYADILRDREELRKAALPGAMNIDHNAPAPSDAGSDTHSSSRCNSSSSSSSASSVPSAGLQDSGSPRPSDAHCSTGRNYSASSSRSFNSTCSAASHAAADAVEEWDQVYHSNSDDCLTSGSDLAVTVDSLTGQMSADWFEEREFESFLEQSCDDGEEEKQEDLDPEDEIPSDSEPEDGSDDEQ
ncbi:hypothetical protein C8J57DRAFT_1534414 [Mycena rebaudengoi]|nr:hypothetical protein C8J57DRAFT_1534414 [Mycena rebaudengoi]